MSIKPLKDYLALEPVGRKPGMHMGLHLPDTGTLASATGCYARVLAAGKDVRDAKPGDIVHLKAYGQHPAGIEVMHSGKPVIMIRERDISGVVTEGGPDADAEGWQARSDWGVTVKQDTEDCSDLERSYLDSMPN